MGTIAQTWCVILRPKNWSMSETKMREVEQQIVAKLKDSLELAGFGPALDTATDHIHLAGHVDGESSEALWSGLAIFFFGSEYDLKEVEKAGEPFDMVLHGAAPIGTLAEMLFEAHTFTEDVMAARLPTDN